MIVSPATRSQQWSPLTNVPLNETYHDSRFSPLKMLWSPVTNVPLNDTHYDSRFSPPEMQWSPVTNVPLNDTYNDSRFSPLKMMDLPSRKPRKSSCNIRKIARRDFDGSSMFTSRHQPLVRPKRKASVECQPRSPRDGYDSVGTITSSESLANHKSSRWVSPSPRNSLRRHSIMEVVGSPVGLNNRWRSSPNITNRKTNAKSTTNNHKRLPPVQNNLGPTGRRWMASLSGEKASDQPIRMITRMVSPTPFTKTAVSLSGKKVSDLPICMMTRQVSPAPLTKTVASLSGEKVANQPIRLITRQVTPPPFTATVASKAA